MRAHRYFTISVLAVATLVSVVLFAGNSNEAQAFVTNDTPSSYVDDCGSAFALVAGNPEFGALGISTVQPQTRLANTNLDGASGEDIDPTCRRRCAWYCWEGTTEDGRTITLCVCHIQWVCDYYG